MPERLEDNPDWIAWVASRPPQIQRAIRDFPPASRIEHDGETLYLIGWGEHADPESVTLLFSVVDPIADWDTAHAPDNVRRICAHHLRPVTG